MQREDSFAAAGYHGDYAAPLIMLPCIERLSLPLPQWPAAIIHRCLKG
jgi:hypothetical protein